MNAEYDVKYQRASLWWYTLYTHTTCLIRQRSTDNTGLYIAEMSVSARIMELHLIMHRVISSLSVQTLVSDKIFKNHFFAETHS